MCNQRALPLRRMTWICRCIPKRKVSYKMPVMPVVSKNTSGQSLGSLPPKTGQKRSLAYVITHIHLLCYKMSYSSFRENIISQQFLQLWLLLFPKPPCILHHLAFIFQYDGTNSVWSWKSLKCYTHLKSAEMPMQSLRRTPKSSNPLNLCKAQALVFSVRKIQS